MKKVLVMFIGLLLCTGCGPASAINSLNEIEKAKEQSTMATVYGYIETVEKTILLSQISPEPIKFEADTEYMVDGLKLKYGSKIIDIDSRTNYDITGTLIFDSNGQIKEAKLKFDNSNKTFYYDGKIVTLK